MIDFLRNTGSYSEKDLSLLEDVMESRILKKDEILLEVGQVCSSICFLKEGAIYQYTIDKENTEHVIDLNIPNDWIINHQSFTGRKPSTYAIKAYKESKIVVVSMDAIHALIAQSQTFLQMGTVLEKAVSRVQFFDQQYSPDEKYEYVLKQQPKLLQTFPQKMLASYLKITPETLSRVRKRIS